MNNDQQRSLCRGGLRSLASLLALSFSMTTYAQSSDDRQVAPVQADEAKASDIIVTALRRSETVQSVAASITALGTERLQNSGISSAEGLAQAVPGLQFSTQAGSMLLAIRGIGLDVSTGAGEPAVAPYINGVYISRVTAPLIDFSDVSRIEVLRGPQGTLYGRNSTAGAINLIAKGVATQLEGEVAVGTGSFDRKMVRGSISGPLAGDVLGFRLSASYDENDGAVRNEYDGSRVNGSKRTYLHGGLTLDNVGSVRNSFDVFYVRENNSGPLEYLFVRNPGYFENNFPGIPVSSVNDNRRISIDTRPRTIRDLLLFTNNLTVSLSDQIDFKSITGYQRHNYSSIFDGDGTNLALVNIGDPVEGYQTNNTRVFTQELNLTGDIGPVNFVGGVYYLKEHTKPFFPAIYPVGIPSLNRAPGFFASFSLDDHTTSKAAFADVTVNISDKLRAVGGLRYSHDRKRVRQNIVIKIPPATVIRSCDNRSFAYSGSSLTPKVGLQYDAAPDVLTYAQFQRAEKAGTFNVSVCGNPVKPEKISAYEVGIKSKIAGGTAIINASAFHYDYTDLQVIVNRPVNGIPSFVLDNAATAKVDGIEVETSLNPSRRLTVSLAVNYLDARYDQYENNAGGVFSGNRLNRAPKWTVKSSAEYRLPLTGFFSELSVRGELDLTSRVYFQPSNAISQSQESVVLINASANLKSDDSGLTLRAFGRNLTNTDVATVLFSSPNQGGIPGFRGMPRSWGLELAKSF